MKKNREANIKRTKRNEQISRFFFLKNGNYVDLVDIINLKKKNYWKLL